MANQRKLTCPHCGGLFDTGQRSNEEHSLFFALISAAFFHWPEETTFTPDNAEHLRAYLLCKAGWRDSEFIEYSGSRQDNERLADILDIQFRRERRKGVYVFITLAPGGVYIHRPRSINKNDMRRLEFREYAERVYALIVESLGLSSIDELKRGMEAA
jgi:hypothetical protein